MACNCAANGPDKEKYAQLDAFIDSLPTTKGELIRVLHTAQGIFGYLPKEVQIYVAKRLNVPVTKIPQSAHLIYFSPLYNRHSYPSFLKSDTNNLFSLSSSM